MSALEAFELLQAHLDQPWRRYAACKGMDPDLFFPSRGANTYQVKQVCASCQVREDCLDYALEHDERFGIWGGLSERERIRIRRTRRQQATPIEKPRVRTIRTTEEKLEIVAYAVEHGLAAASNRYGAHITSIKDWSKGQGLYEPAVASHIARRENAG